ncbi:MAG: hypothetical protein LC104_07600 [Bacteroidales bacterium]|nr:hypothetical protein [Bacteroidales bacterium]
MIHRSVLFGIGIVVVLGVVLGMALVGKPTTEAIPTEPQAPTTPAVSDTQPSTQAETPPLASPPAVSESAPVPPSAPASGEMAPAPRRIPDRYLYPNDTGGLLTRRVLALPVPPLPPVPLRDTPSSWRPPLERAEFPLPRTMPKIPMVSTEPPAPPRLTPMGETVPLDLGRGAEVDLRTLRFPRTSQ